MAGDANIDVQAKVDADISPAEKELNKLESRLKTLTQNKHTVTINVAGDAKDANVQAVVKKFQDALNKNPTPVELNPKFTINDTKIKNSLASIRRQIKGLITSNLKDLPNIDFTARIRGDIDNIQILNSLAVAIEVTHKTVIL